MISGSMAAKQTRGFKSLLHRIDHFTAHGKGLGMPTEEDYESFADQFLGQPCPKGVRQFTRSWNGDVVRYDETWMFLVFWIATDSLRLATGPIHRSTGRSPI